MPLVNISNGELLDRLSILEIKLAQLNDKDALGWVSKEIEPLRLQARDLLEHEILVDLYEELLLANLDMWNAMQLIYDWSTEINEEYVSIIVSIIDVNQKRAGIKRAVDELTGSEIREAKSFFEELKSEVSE